MTGDFRRIVSTIAHLPAAACTTSAPGSKSPLGRGGGAAQRALGVLPGFPVVGGRLCRMLAMPVAIQWLWNFAQALLWVEGLETCENTSN